MNFSNSYYLCNDKEALPLELENVPIYLNIQLHFSICTHVVLCTFMQCHTSYKCTQAHMCVYVQWERRANALGKIIKIFKGCCNCKMIDGRSITFLSAVKTMPTERDLK